MQVLLFAFTVFRMTEVKQDISKTVSASLFGHVCKKETLSIEYAFLIAMIDVRRSGRVAEGTPLLRVQTGKNRSRGFESLLLRHFHI